LINIIKLLIQNETNEISLYWIARKTKDLYNDIEDTLEANDKIDPDCNSLVTNWYHHCKTPEYDRWELVYYDGWDCDGCKYGRDHDHNICDFCFKPL
jgi:hypothetical protein